MKHKTIIQTIIFFLALSLVGVFYLFINAPSSIIISQPFSIAKGESIASISSRLRQENFIYSDLLFRFYLKMTNKAQDIKAGYYLIPGRANTRTIVQLITNNQVAADGNFLIKEGDTLKDIDSNLHENNILNDSQVLTDLTIKDFNSNYEKLFKDILDNNSLEGYLFPDSYHLPQGLSEKEIVDAFLNNFSNKTKDLNIPYKDLIMASILEKEVQTEIDKRMVADILWRRLKENIPLQVDATICYAQNQSFSDCQLTEKAFKTDSPYNTYLYKGLPPTPICNPGLESIKAALNPLSNQSWYYLTDRKTGKTIFSKTYEEHSQARRKYL